MLKKLMALFEKAFDKAVDASKKYAKAHPIATAVLLVVAMVSFGIGVGVGQEQGDAEPSDAEPSAATQAVDSEPDLRNTVDDLQAQVDSLEDQLADAEEQVQQASAQVPLPDLTGKNLSDVETILGEHGWQIGAKSFQETDSAPEGTVLNHSPKAGKTMTYGASIKLTIAKAPPPGWKDIKVWSGQGPFNTPEVRIPNSKVRLVYDFNGSTNAIVVLKRRPNKYVELFLNEIGDRSGTTRVYYAGKYYFNIEGGTWIVKLQEWR